MKRHMLLTLCLMMLFQICSRGYCQTGDAKTDVDALRIRAGWVAPSAGYFLTDSAMRDTITGWTTARKEADIRQQALEALREEIRLQQADLKRQLAALQTEIDAERRAYRSRIRGSKVQGLIYGTVIGFAGGYLVRRNNP